MGKSAVPYEGRAFSQEASEETSGSGLPEGERSGAAIDVLLQESFGCARRRGRQRMVFDGGRGEWVQSDPQLEAGDGDGPDDFSYVVDRAYTPGLNRKMRFGKQCVAYVDDLTIRTGRVIGNRHLTDEEAEEEIKSACREAAVVPPQAAATALENLGVSVQGSGSRGKKQKWDTAVSDHNHPTRSGSLRLVVRSRCRPLSPQRSEVRGVGSVGGLSRCSQRSLARGVGWCLAVMCLCPQPFLSFGSRSFLAAAMSGRHTGGVR